MSKQQKPLKPRTKKQFYELASKGYERLAELDRVMPDWWKNVKLKAKLNVAIVRKIRKLEELQVKLHSVDWTGLSTEQLAELFDAAASSGIQLSKPKQSPDDWIRVPLRKMFPSKQTVAAHARDEKKANVIRSVSRGVYEIRRKHLPEYLEGKQLEEFKNM